jgi:nuclear cap-binding protein subunit 1
LNRIVEQPFKIPFIAAVVLVVNTQKSDVTVDVLRKAGQALQQSLNLGVWRDVKLLLRFLGCLQGLLEGEGVFPVLDDIFARAVDLQTASSEDVCASPSSCMKGRC